MCSTNEPKMRRSTSPMVNAGSRTILARGNAASHDDGSTRIPQLYSVGTTLYTWGHDTGDLAIQTAAGRSPERLPVSALAAKRPAAPGCDHCRTPAVTGEGLGWADRWRRGSGSAAADVSTPQTVSIPHTPRKSSAVLVGVRVPRSATVRATPKVAPSCRIAWLTAAPAANSSGGSPCTAALVSCGITRATPRPANSDAGSTWLA